MKKFEVIALLVPVVLKSLDLLDEVVINYKTRHLKYQEELEMYEYRKRLRDNNHNSVINR